MPAGGPSVIVVDADPSAAQRTASLVTFLEYDAVVAPKIEALPDLFEKLPNTVAMLVAMDANYTLLKSALQAARDTGIACAVFLMQHKDCSATLPPALGSRVNGTISLEAGYQELLHALHTSQSLTSCRGKVSGELVRNLVGHSRPMQQVRRLIGQVADTDASVLITGESGTGKEAVARNVHNLSGRRGKPFVPINCGAIPAELLESELFGHEKGAFTGAISSRQGRFEVADGGTLFLDEIGDMPLDMQIKLLRVLQERTFERVGSHKVIRANVRIVAATHQNLEQLVSERRFRMDLFYRLHVFPIMVPPLRERAGDIPVLVEGFIRKLEREQGLSLKLSDCAKATLARYFWPGNVRELFNLIERLAILHPHKLVMWSDLPEKFRPNQELFQESTEIPAQISTAEPLKMGENVLPEGGIDLKPHLANIETCLMTQALAQSDWVVARAAKLLNLQRTTLVEKIRKLDLRRPEELTDF